MFASSVSTAFDTVDCGLLLLLLQRQFGLCVDCGLLLLLLQRQFGLCGTVIQWFHSYLGEKSFRVVHH